jgi:hypothetical protein
VVISLLFSNISKNLYNVSNRAVGVAADNPTARRSPKNGGYVIIQKVIVQLRTKNFKSFTLCEKACNALLGHMAHSQSVLHVKVNKAKIASNHRLTSLFFWPFSKLAEMNEDEILKDEDDSQMSDETFTTPDETVKSEEGSKKDMTVKSLSVVEQGVGNLQVDDKKKATSFPSPEGPRKPKKKKNNQAKGLAPKADPHKPIERIKRVLLEEEDGAQNPPSKKRFINTVSTANQVVLVKKNGSEASEEDFRIFQQTIAKEIKDLHGSMQVKIQRLIHRNGSITINCIDTATKFWIEAKAPKWGKQEYSIADSEDGKVKVSFFIYGDEINRTDFLKTISEQNGMDTLMWRILTVYPHKPKKSTKVTGHIVVLIMSPEDFQKINGKPIYYLFNEIYPKQWDKKSSDDKEGGDKASTSEQSSGLQK